MGRLLAGMMVLVIGGCTPAAPECRHPCGVFTRARCDGFIAAVDAGLIAFDGHVTPRPGRPPWTRATMCSALAGIEVTIAPMSDGGSYIDAWGRRVAGEYLGPRIELASDTWATSALTHEMAHAFEDRIDQNIPVTDHSDWQERGLWAALQMSHL